MTTIKVPFPIYEGLEVKNATVDIENGVAVVEYGEKEFIPKRGDVIATESSSCIIIFDEFDRSEDGQKRIYAGLNEGGIVKYSDSTFGNVSVWRPAAPAEQQLLFDALAKEGKKWNPETLQLEDIQKDIIVPESIGIYKHKEMVCSQYDKGDGLHISLNGNKQLLSTSDGVYHVQPFGKSLFEKIQCKLVPYKREDLKPGDTAFASVRDNYYRVDYYCKIIEGCVAYCSKMDVMVRKWGNPDLIWYKVEPINCK